MVRVSWIPVALGSAALGWAAARRGLLDDVAGLFFERPEVARLVTIRESLGGITLHSNSLSDHHLQNIHCPGLINGSIAVLFLKTLHTGRVGFTVRFGASNQHLINHTFADDERGPRSWHVLIPSGALKPHDNELILARITSSDADSRVTFSDVAILYRSNKLTVVEEPVFQQ